MSSVTLSCMRMKGEGPSTVRRASAVEPVGELPPEYEPADRAKVVKATAEHEAKPMSWEETDSLTRSPWIYTFADGYRSCLLCMKWMTEQHVASVKHKKKHRGVCEVQA